MKTGFRCTGFMSRNDVINYPIQGAAFHCLLWSFVKINDWIKKYCKKSMVIGQIHDSIVMDIHPSELNKIMRACNKIMTKDVRKHWDWIILPLEIEAECTPVDGSWFLKKEIVNKNCVCGSKWIYDKTGECPVCGEINK